MRVVVRIMLQFGIVFAAMAAFVIASGDPRMWLILFYFIAIVVPGTLVSALVLAPLERWLERRGQGTLIYAGAPAATAVLALLFMQFSGNGLSEIVAALPAFLATGASWGLLWAATRPVARLLFGPEST